LKTIFLAFAVMHIALIMVIDILRARPSLHCTLCHIYGVGV
jgi:hypothetical protein